MLSNRQQEKLYVLCDAAGNPYSSGKFPAIVADTINYSLYEQSSPYRWIEVAEA